jgi:16S rRNA (adenine1518-N6/adenine1519-N6)-dimethyltransferase
MKKNQKLGQHFLKSQKIAQIIVDSAKIQDDDTILEIGTGEGILTPLLCTNAKKVISLEVDKNLYSLAKTQFGNYSNLKLKHGDGFKIKEHFSILISNLPYSKSRHAIEWLIQQNFSHAIVMVQKEFAEKLLTDSKKERKAITILANHSLKIEKILKVGKEQFHPPPKIESLVLRLTRKKTVSDEIIKTVNKLFSYRRKTLHNILKQFGKKSEDDKRLDDLNGDEIIKIAKQIIKK